MGVIAPPHRSVLSGLPPVDAPRGDSGSQIAVTMKYAPLSVLLGLCTPVLEVDGQAVPAEWGRVVTAVTLGPHLVHVHVPYLMPSRIGVAETTVVAPPGRTVELEYRAPLLKFLDGAIGSPPQRYPGLATAIFLLIVSVTLMLCACIGILTNL